jgi:hypothetical protein
LLALYLVVSLLASSVGFAAHDCPVRGRHLSLGNTLSCCPNHASQTPLKGPRLTRKSCCQTFVFFQKIDTPQSVEQSIDQPSGPLANLPSYFAEFSTPSFTLFPSPSSRVSTRVSAWFRPSSLARLRWLRVFRL